MAASLIDRLKRATERYADAECRGDESEFELASDARWRAEETILKHKSKRFRNEQFAIIARRAMVGLDVAQALAVIAANS